MASASEQIEDHIVPVHMQHTTAEIKRQRRKSIPESYGVVQSGVYIYSAASLALSRRISRDVERPATLEAPRRSTVGRAGNDPYGRRSYAYLYNIVFRCPGELGDIALDSTGSSSFCLPGTAGRRYARGTR
jgi:hypothetical protein